MNNLPVVLYVDDEPVNLELFALNFRKKFRVLTAESGNAGLHILSSEPDIQVVISDMKMPGMSGIGFIRAAKSRFSSLSYFILTGFEITDEIAKALDEGLIISYFRKPFNLKEMENAITNVLHPEPK